MTTTTEPPYLTALLRHFGDLRDGNHHAAVTRAEKEAVFAATVPLLEPVARSVLDELNHALLLDAGRVVATGLTHGPTGSEARWTLSWPEQQAAGIQPITLLAFYGSGFHHPHLRGATLGDWPLNVFSAVDAEGQRDTMRAIVSADLHNLVFQADFRIVPAMAQR